MEKARQTVSRLCRRLACETITPLGVPVDPEVYCRNASVSGVGHAGDQGTGVIASLAVVAATAMTGSRPCEPDISGRVPATSAVLSTTRASASPTMALTRSAPRFLRGG